MIVSRVSGPFGIWAFLTVSLGGAAPVSAQTGDSLLVHRPDDSSFTVPVTRLRGYATVPHDALRELGWEVEVDALSLRAQLGPDGPVVEFSLGSPFFRWDDELLQLVDAPFLGGGSIQIPLQFVVDFLPYRAREAYAFSPEERVLEILDPSLWPGGRIEIRRAGREGGALTPTDGPAPTDAPSAPTLQQDLRATQDPEKRVVVIDPGHGGSDAGTTGAGGRREKDIALAIGRYLERELRGDESLEVYLTRDRDVLVPLWERGPRATLLKGTRPGVFISIHVNSSPSSPAIRGFETYFLSEARTEHERRVAAIENAPLQLDTELDGGDVEADVAFIMRELQYLDHQHWSELLAEGIQSELEEVHPGPNRGVKQGPFAVITNALMPAVLVEVGFISNREEERVLSRGEFQRGVAAALAQGIRDFFLRYPPGQGVAVQGAPR